MIIQDPLALNWERPQQAINITKETLEQALTGSAANKDIKLLMNTYNQGTYDKLVDYLSTIQPCVPRVLNEILRNSPEGAKLNFISTFIDMRTMKGILEFSEARNLLDSLQEADLEQISFLCKLYEKINGLTFFSETKYSRTDSSYIRLLRRDWLCTSELANNLRELSWDRKINASTTPHPFEQFIISKVVDGNCHGCYGEPEMIEFILINPIKK